MHSMAVVLGSSFTTPAVRDNNTNAAYFGVEITFS